MGATKDLATILSQRDATKYRDIIVRALNNGYHDHKFDKIPGHPEYGKCVCPKVELFAHLSKFPELNDIRDRVVNGEFDEKPDAEDVEEMRGWLIADKAPNSMFDTFKIPRPTEAERKLGRPINN